jgi:enamine deaminase RidA (YjgF/YER057c/UK114 family)
VNGNRHEGFWYQTFEREERMSTNTRRKFLAASVPALAVATAVPAAGQQSPSGKKVFRKSTGPFKKDGPPLYSTELTFGNLVFVSGKGAGVDAKGDIKEQTTRVLDQIEESLKIAGSSMEKVLKVSVFLANMDDYNGMNEAYLGRFGQDPPVRTTVSVASLPDRSRVEIDCIAHL